MGIRLALTLAFVAQFALAEDAPRLVVNVVVDQLRSDLLDAYAPVFGDGGFARLTSEGRVFSRVRVPFDDVDRASAVACLMSGALPGANGIEAERWLDRRSLLPVGCTDDATPGNLLVSTVGDELKVSSGGRSLVYSVAAMRDAAILSAGHAADGAMWVDGQSGTWDWASYYGAQPQWFGYHGRSSATDVNVRVTDMAVAAIKSAAMGVDHWPDLLNVTYSAAPQADMQDLYTTLDQQLDKLIDFATERSRGSIVVVLSGTGYADEVCDVEELRRWRIPTGEFSLERAQFLLGMFLSATYGQGQWVEASFGRQIYLNRDLIEKKKLGLEEVIGKCVDFLGQLDGVASAAPTVGLRHGGDISLRVQPGWQLEGKVQRNSYLAFPIVIYGPEVEAKTVAEPVSIDRLAPTLSGILHIRPPNGAEAMPL